MTRVTGTDNRVLTTVQAALAIVALWLRRSRLCVGVSFAALFVSTMGASLAALALSLPGYPYGLNAPSKTGLAPSDQLGTFRKVNNASEIPGLTDRLRGMLGKHFFLDNLPDYARTIETGYNYLISKTTSRVISETMRPWKEAYGAELQIQHEGKSITVLLWSDTSDFSGRLVYAVSTSDGYPWQVYLEPARK